jgi:hypothetical protein
MNIPKIREAASGFIFDTEGLLERVLPPPADREAAQECIEACLNVIEYIDIGEIDEAKLRELAREMITRSDRVKEIMDKVSAELDEELRRRGFEQ